MPTDSTIRYVASTEQVSTMVGGEVVILDMRAGLYFGLDAVGARLWELLTELRTIGELVDVVVAEYDVERERAQTDVVALIGELLARELIAEVGA